MLVLLYVRFFFSVFDFCARSGSEPTECPVGVGKQRRQSRPGGCARGLRCYFLARVFLRHQYCHCYFVFVLLCRNCRLQLHSLSRSRSPIIVHCCFALHHSCSPSCASSSAAFLLASLSCCSFQSSLLSYYSFRLFTTAR